MGNCFLLIITKTYGERGVVCSEFRSFGSVREPSWGHLRMRVSPKWSIGPFGRVGKTDFFLNGEKTRDISLSIRPSLWIPTTLRYSPLLPVSKGLTAKIASPPKFSEHSRPGGTPETRHGGCRQ